MKFYQETTDYGDTIANGTYLLDDTMTYMHAFIPAGTKTVKTFKSPIRIDSRRRTFKVVKNTFGYKIKTASDAKTWQITGSKGDIYTVTETDTGLRCSCQGFKFRGACKHTAQVKDGL